MTCLFIVQSLKSAFHSQVVNLWLPSRDHDFTSSMECSIGFALCCHSNATRAPIANPPNSAQLGGSLYHAPTLHPGLCSSVGVRPRTDRQTHRHAWPQYILRRLRLTQNV